jgi:protein gp37
MGENSGISWTDHTFNPWWSCVEASPACDHCYARVLAARFGYAWGAEAPRRFFDDRHWAEPIRWNLQAERAGERKRVFCASMGDVFERLPRQHADRERMDAERRRLWALIEATPWLDWMLLTKRAQNIARMLPAAWLAEPRRNVWLGVTGETQEWADRRLRRLLQVPAVVHFLSAEPLLGAIDVHHWLESSFWPTPDGPGNTLDWVITGGESGRQARPMNPDWAAWLRDQCQAAGAAFHHKQNGEFARHVSIPPEAPSVVVEFGSQRRGEFRRLYRVGRLLAGRLLGGRIWDEFPEPRYA